jgi:hypothetical protein
MRTRTIIACLSLLALDAAAAGAARAQSVADAAHTMRAMDLRMHSLNASRKSLQQMDLRQDEQQAGAAREISDADVAVFAAAVKVFTVAYIVTGMKCPDDVRYLQQQFDVVVQSFLTTAEAELARVNANLPVLSAPSARAEAVSIRDVIGELRDILEPFAPLNQSSAQRPGAATP